MPDPSPLVAQARIALVDPAGMMRRLCEHFVEHGEVTMTETGGQLDGPYGRVLLHPSGPALIVTAQCPDEARLFLVKSSVAEHLAAFCEGERLDFAWSGAGASTTEIPYFREMTVVGARDVTPHMRRVTLAGADVGHFEQGGLHVRVLIPPGPAPRWPHAGADGRIVWPKRGDELTGRIYTIRSVDRARGQVEIDVVLHGGSPGSRWARGAAAGDRVGLMGPGGGAVPTADWYLLAGDETALPAIARILEGLPPQARATVLIEVADAREEQAIGSAGTVELRWLHRDGVEAGRSDRLADAVRGVVWPDSDEPYVMIGCEHRTARLLRSHLRRERGLARERHHCLAYWRRGQAASGSAAED